VVGHEMYFLIYGYSDYNRVKMVEEVKEKTKLISKWGAYAYNDMPFGYVMPMLLSKNSNQDI
jgi:hypothetical protein